jgi:putative transposase
MKKNRYTEEQVAYALTQAELGTAVPEICRKLGILYLQRSLKTTSPNAFLMHFLTARNLHFYIAVDNKRYNISKNLSAACWGR